MSLGFVISIGKRPKNVGAVDPYVASQIYGHGPMVQEQSARGERSLLLHVAAADVGPKVSLHHCALRNKENALAMRAIFLLMWT